ncbi:10986_t:CDS:2, partial [Racocetra persica]
GFKLKEILENIIDEDWFTEQKRQVDYELSEVLKPYLKRERSIKYPNSLSMKERNCMGRIFSITENPIHDHIVASRYFKELADDKRSKLRLQAAEAYANIIRVKAMGRLGGPNEALPYLEIAIDLKKADIYFAIYSVYVELGKEDNA